MWRWTKVSSSEGLFLSSIQMDRSCSFFCALNFWEKILEERENEKVEVFIQYLTKFTQVKEKQGYAFSNSWWSQRKVLASDKQSKTKNNMHQNSAQRVERKLYETFSYNPSRYVNYQLIDSMNLDIHRWNTSVADLNVNIFWDVA